MNVNKVFKVDIVSKDDLIVWFRKNISNRLHTIEELGNGGDFLQAMDILIPGSVSLQRVKFQKTTETERLRHFKTLRKIFHKLGVDKDIEAEKMVKGLFKENYHFALWFRAFFRANYKGGCQSPFESGNARKSKQKSKLNLVDEDSQEYPAVSRKKDDLPNINQNSKVNESMFLSKNLRESEKEHILSRQIGTIRGDSSFENKNVRNDIGRLCTVKNTSKQDLIRWFRSTLSPNLHSIEELGTGADFCLGLEVLFPGSIPMHQIRFSKTTESERVTNFRILDRTLDGLGIQKEICAERLAKGIFKDNFQFAQWYKAFFLCNYRGQTYDINEIRAAKKKKVRSRLDLQTESSMRLASKENLPENIGQGDAFSEPQLPGKRDLGLPEVGIIVNHGTMVDASSQTDQPLPIVNKSASLLAGDGDIHDKLLQIRLACEQLPNNELSKMIARLIDGPGNNDVDDDEDGDGGVVADEEDFQNDHERRGRKAVEEVAYEIDGYDGTGLDDNDVDDGDEDDDVDIEGMVAADEDEDDLDEEEREEIQLYHPNLLPTL